MTCWVLESEFPAWGHHEILLHASPTDREPIVRRVRNGRTVATDAAYRGRGFAYLEISSLAAEISMYVIRWQAESTRGAESMYRVVP